MARVWPYLFYTAKLIWAATSKTPSAFETHICCSKSPGEMCKINDRVWQIVFACLLVLESCFYSDFRRCCILNSDKMIIWFRGTCSSQDWMATVSGIGFCLFYLLCIFAVSTAKQEPKGAIITLKAKWEGTSLLLEAGEFLVRYCFILLKLSLI